MFTKENGKTLVVVLVAIILADVLVRPMIAKITKK
jgi:hypothetical protein